MKDKDCTILIKTFKRPACLIRLLKSIDSFASEYPIIIVDDSENSSKSYVSSRFPHMDITYVELPFNRGLSAGRNAGLRLVETSFFLLCDDDFVFDKGTNIERGVEVIRESGVDILGGFLRDYPGRNYKNFVSKIRTIIKSFVYQKLGLFKVRNYLIEIQILGRDLKFILDTERRVQFQKCDGTLNFFVAKADSVKKVLWNEELKVVEHSEFFLRAKLAGLEVAACDAFSVRHFKEKSIDYLEYRQAKEAEGKAIKAILGIGFDSIRFEKNGREFKEFRRNNGDIERVDGLMQQAERVSKYQGKMGAISRFGKKRKIRKYGGAVIEQLQKALESSDVSYWLEFGTLLGAFRESGIMAHDIDIDIGVLSTSVPEGFDEIMEQFGFSLKSSFSSKEKIFEKSYLFLGKVSVDIFFVFEEGGKYCVYDFVWDKSVDRKKFREEMGGSMCYKNSMSPFELSKIGFCGMEWNAPSNIEEHLKELYGEDFQTPNPGWVHSSRTIREPTGMIVKRKRYP